MESNVVVILVIACALVSIGIIAATIAISDQKDLLPTNEKSTEKQVFIPICKYCGNVLVSNHCEGCGAWIPLYS